MKDRDIVAASEVMRQAIARSTRANLGIDALRLLQVFHTFLLSYSLTEDTIAESQLREELHNMDGRSFERAWRQLVDAKIMGRETNGLKGRAARTRWWYISNDEAAGLDEIDALTASSETPAEIPAGIPAETPAPLRVTEYRSPRPEGPRYSDVDRDPASPLSKRKSEESGLPEGRPSSNGSSTTDPFSKDPSITFNGWTFEQVLEGVRSGTVYYEQLNGPSSGVFRTTGLKIVRGEDLSPEQRELILNVQLSL